MPPKLPLHLRIYSRYLFNIILLSNFKLHRLIYFPFIHINRYLFNQKPKLLWGRFKRLKHVTNSIHDITKDST